MRQVIGSAIRQGSLEIVPNELVRVELGGVARKEVRLKARVSAQELSRRTALVRSAPVPKQDDGAAQVLEELVEEASDLRRLDVLAAIETGVKGHPPLLRRDADGGDGRDLTPTAGAAQAGRLAPGRPRPGHVRDQEEAAFVEEDQMGAKFFGFFLYGANGSASNGRLPSRPFLGLASPAFDSSTPGVSVSSRRWEASNGCRSAPRFVGAPGSASKGPWNTPFSAGSSAGCGPTAAFAGQKGAPGVPASGAASIQVGLPCGTPAATAPQSSARRRAWRLPSGADCRIAITRWLAGGASPVEEGLQGVSCPKGYELWQKVSIC